MQMEKAMAPHSSTFAWRIPWMEEPGGLQSMGSLRVGHDWATSLSLSNAGGVGLIPGWGAKIPHPLWPKNQNIKQKQYYNKFNQDFENGHINKNVNMSFRIVYMNLSFALQLCYVFSITDVFAITPSQMCTSIVPSVFLSHEETVR